MGKYKIGQNKTIFGGMFPQCLPKVKNGGETNNEKPHEDHITEPQNGYLIRFGPGLIRQTMTDRKQGDTDKQEN